MTIHQESNRYTISSGDHLVTVRNQKTNGHDISKGN